MSAQGLLPLYNQDRLDDATFIANFVARHAEFDSLLASLHANAKGGAARHEIIVGARGMGKTSLLRRIAIAIGDDEELSRIFVPLRFREEQYNVISLGAFWRNCCDALAEWCEKAERPDLAKRLDAAIEKGDAGTLEAAFLDVCTTLGRRAVLLLDNLDLILDNLKDDDTWRLRSVLQSARGPIVIGAATQFLAQSGDRNAPFYEFFHPHILEPLGEKELLACLRALAGARGEKGAAVIALLAKEPERALALYALTGGNPRILALIYQLLERADSHEIFADLEALLDQVTAFYKARVEEYTGANQRAVIDAVALNWDPISSNEIAAATSITVTSISSILDRLKRDGFIEEVQGSGARAKYQLAERFLNIWYLMRHGTRQTRQRLRWLTMLLARLFSESELERMARDGERLAGVWRADWCDAVREAHAEVIRAREERLLESGDQLQELASTDFGEVGSIDGARELLVEALRSLGTQNFDRALVMLDDWIAHFGRLETPTLQELIARAQVNRGFVLDRLGRGDEAIAVYNDLIARFEASEAPVLQEGAARALFNKGVTIGRLGRPEDAIAAYNELVSRFGASEAPALLELVQRALINKGVALAGLGREEDALLVYDDLITRFGASEAPALQERVARALFNKGAVLGRLGRAKDEIAVYDDLIVRFGVSKAPTLQEHVAGALANKGVALGRLGRAEEALVIYDDLISRVGASEVPALREHVMRARSNRGVMLEELGRADDALVAYDDVIARLESSDALTLQETFAAALSNKGGALVQLHRAEEALIVYADLIARFRASESPALQERVAGALLNRGATLWRLGRAEEALDAYDELIARFEALDALALQELVARALLNKGFTLGNLGLAENEIAVFDDLIARFGKMEAPALKEPLVQACNGKGRLLADRFCRHEEAEAAYRRGLSFAPQDEILRANLAWLLLEIDRATEAEPLIAELSSLAPEGRALLDAGREIAADNFGSGVAYLGKALDTQLEDGKSPFFEDLLRLLRLAAARGFGERLLDWFKESGNADRYAPVYGAFVAKVRGEQYLRDLNPEVRRFAEKFYDFLSRPKKEEPPVKKPRRSTRRRR